MKIKSLPSLPERMEGHLTLAQIKDFNEGDRAILIAISEVRQLTVFGYNAIAVAVEQARKSEYEMVKKIARIKSVLSWVCGVVFVAVVSALMLKIFHT